MNNLRRIALSLTYMTAFLFVAGVVAGSALADSADAQIDAAATPPPSTLIAQIKVIKPSPSPVVTPTPTPTLTPSPTLTPTLTPTPKMPTPPPVHDGKDTMVRLPCQVTAVKDLPSDNCRSRYIFYKDLYRDVHTCKTARCFALKFLEIDRAPTVVIYTGAHAERARAHAALREDMVYGVEKMGAYLKERAGAGAAGLPNMSEIKSLVNQATREVDSIDQPIDETPEQQRARLGLGSAMRLLAKYTRDH